VRRGLRMLVDASPTRLSLLRAGLVTDVARQLLPAYDVVISAENEAAVGQPIVQYVHYPRFLRPRPVSDRKWFHHMPGAMRAYWSMCDWILDRSEADIARNTTLANSAWTAERVRALYPSTPVTVVYPPVDDAAPVQDWTSREDGFVCIGRFSGEKDPAAVIDIVSAVRREFPHVRLHFAGVRAGRGGFRQLVRLVRPHRAWIEIHENLSRRELRALVARNRYGIHGMPEEHFGIGPAEMVRAGCIVFLPAGGGQVEIVKGDARVLYRTRQEAVARILHVMKNPVEQASIRAALEVCGRTFGTDRFSQSIREVVDRFRAERLAEAAS
jgi:glycosyltransferase involved in cell wall biosynthesis